MTNLSSHAPVSVYFPLSVILSLVTSPEAFENQDSSAPCADACQATGQAVIGFWDRDERPGPMRTRVLVRAAGEEECYCVTIITRWGTTGAKGCLRVSCLSTLQIETDAEHLAEVKTLQDPCVRGSDEKETLIMGREPPCTAS